MRTLLVLSLTICLLFSMTTMASADVFRITPEISNADLDTGADSISGNIYSVSGDLNFVVVRTGVDLGTGEFDNVDYKMTGARVGTELPLLFFKLIAYAGYNSYEFEQDSKTTFQGTVLGVGAEYKMNNFFSLRGVVLVPVDMEMKDSSADLDFSSTKLDLIFTTLPLVDVFVGYRAMNFDAKGVTEIDLSGFSAGVRVGI